MPKETNKKQSKAQKHFFKDFKAELKRVIWPTPKQLVNNTVAVISIVLITAIIVFALDFAFEKMNEHGIEKLKTIVESKDVESNTTVDNQVQNEVNDENAVENATANDVQNSNEVLNTINE